MLEPLLGDAAVWVRVLWCIDVGTFAGGCCCVGPCAVVY
jgi:hypothetical protein